MNTAIARSRDPERSSELSLLKRTSDEPQGIPFPEMIGKSIALKQVLTQIETVAPTNATVLILGETGTGKELVARAIHRLSTRRDSAFVTVNCAGIPAGLLESELFGYERGAFTGAFGRKLGRFELAAGGTLFLDEVGDIPMDLQPKLLRALQEKVIERLGGNRSIPMNVRLIAATNCDLLRMMADKTFRSDLYYRLHVFPIRTPPLRDRPEDIAVLSHHFMGKYGREMNRQVNRISPETMQALMLWNWPGNVRELENFIERSVILSDGDSLIAPLENLRTDDVKTISSSLFETDRAHILGVLRRAGGVISNAASQLGIPRTTLIAKMQKLGISRQDAFVMGA